jgi:hypothetical protein
MISAAALASLVPLVRTNWIRTRAWSARGLLLFGMLWSWSVERFV